MRGASSHFGSFRFFEKNGSRGETFRFKPGRFEWAIVAESLFEFFTKFDESNIIILTDGILSTFVWAEELSSLIKPRVATPSEVHLWIRESSR